MGDDVVLFYYLTLDVGANLKMEDLFCRERGICYFIEVLCI